MVVVLYLVAGEHFLHQAFVFRGVVALVGGGEGPVWTAAEKKKKAVKPEMLSGHDINRNHSRAGS